jgi:hypothetical protein
LLVDSVGWDPLAYKTREIPGGIAFSAFPLFDCFVAINFYIYSTNIIQIQDKLIINYVIQTQCQINIILKFKIFLNSQD